MKVKFKILYKVVAIIISIICSTSVFAQNKKLYPKELVQMRANLETLFLKEALNADTVKILYNTLSKKGAWPDIDYTSKQRGHWAVIAHLENLQILCRAYLKSGNPYYHNRTSLDKINLALDYWLKNDFVSPNWWYPQIGIPQALAPILIVMEDELSNEQIETGIKILNKSKIGMGGQNKVWLAGNVMMKSLLLRNVDSVAIAAKTIEKEVKVSTGLGIQPDNSFHEHGSMLQLGNYGLHFLDDMVKWLAILDKTPFQFDKSKISIIRNYVLDGMQWVVYKKSFDIAASGRHLFINEQEIKRNDVIDHFHDLANLDPAYADSYIKATDYKNLVGNKHFWNSDYHVQRTPNYFFTLKMSSSRVGGYESANSENMLGYHLGSGMTLLYQTDDEYKNIFPFWDWKKLPGTTIIQDKAAIPVTNAWGYKIVGDFVGGVTDSKNGIAVLKYTRGGLEANKSWFMFNDQIICLGNGITADTSYNVTTSVNQSYLNGDVIVSSKNVQHKVSGDQSFVNPNWVLHNNIGYYFPDGGNVEVSAKSVTGSWYKVAQRYPDVNEKANIFSLWINHGKKPKDSKYQYVLVPNATEQKMKDLNAKASFNITNEMDKQMVVATDGKLAGIVFYKAGTANIFGGITVDQPCLVMIKNSGNDLEISISEPTHLLNNINLTINGSYKNDIAKVLDGKTLLNIKLPTTDLAGSSLNYKLLKINK
jgi:chondroitin AC lyase